MTQLFRVLPSVDICLSALENDETLRGRPRPMLRQAVNDFLDQQRKGIREGAITDAACLAQDVLLPFLRQYALAATAPRLRRVINATGVVIHTNMGRSVLAEDAVTAVGMAAAGYTNLELDLKTGERGSRQSLVEELICSLTGGEAAMAVNNNAAAVLLALDSLCKGGEVIVSRGQLVEIGGSFRIPEVMEKSGAVLREVGATNRTHLRDYANAINEHTVALLRVHTSNYRIVGFHKEVSLPELAALGRERSLPVIEDLGGGSLMDFTPWGLPGEPTVQDVVRQGADVVTCSGDKVLGGPQAGIIVGRKDLVARMHSNPLHRAFRCDKFTLAALEATLRLYTDPEKALQTIPTLRMMTMTPQELEQQAEALREQLAQRLGTAAVVTLRSSVSRVGGGAFPERDLPTTLVCVHPSAMSATQLKYALLETSIPLLGRLEEDCFCLDPRTLAAGDVPLAIAALVQALSE